MIEKDLFQQAPGLYMHMDPPMHLYPMYLNTHAHMHTYHTHIHMPKKKKSVFIDRMSGVQDMGLSQEYLQSQVIEKLRQEDGLSPGIGVIVKLSSETNKEM